MGRRQLTLPFASITALLLLQAAAPADARVLRRVIRSSLFDVASACHAASFPKLCQTLQGATVEALTAAAVDVAAAKAKEAQATATRLMAAPGCDKMVASSLDVCQQNFESAVDSLQAAAKNLKAVAPHAELMNNLSAAVAFVGTCDDAFKERKGLVSPVAHVNDNLRQLVSNSLSLADGLKN